MYEIYQKTLSKEVKFKGIGLHSGKASSVNVIPAKEDKGIVFKRVDLNKNNEIKANFKNVTSAKLCTTLENNHGVKVSTVEHLLAALYIVGIDNAIIEIDNEEVPIMDGSSRDFINAFEKNDLVNQTKKRKYLKISSKIELTDGKRRISIEPNDLSLEVNFQLNYKNKIIGKQKNTIDFQADNLDEVSSSRTFCLYEDIEKLRAMGFAKGGSLDNALVVKDDKLLNSDGLRNNKEFVNHKILDCMGDLFLSGYKIIGKIKCSQGGHKLTNDLLRKVFQNKENYSISEINEKNVPHSLVYRQNLKSIA